MADNSNKDLNALVKAQETAGSVNDLVDEYVHLTLVGGGNPSPTGDDLWHAKEGIGKLFRAELESGDSDTIMRALNGLAELRRQARLKDKKGGDQGDRPIGPSNRSAGALNAAAGADAEGGSDVSPDKPSRSDHGRSQFDQDSQREKQAKGKEPAHPQADDGHDHGKKHK